MLIWMFDGAVGIILCRKQPTTSNYCDMRRWSRYEIPTTVCDLCVELLCCSRLPFFVFEGLVDGSGFSVFRKLESIKVFGVGFGHTRYCPGRHWMNILRRVLRWLWRWRRWRSVGGRGLIFSIGLGLIRWWILRCWVWKMSLCRWVCLGRGLRPIMSVSSGLWSWVLLGLGWRPIFVWNSGLRRGRNRMRLRVRGLYLIWRTINRTGWQRRWRRLVVRDRRRGWRWRNEYEWCWLRGCSIIWRFHMWTFSIWGIDNRSEREDLFIELDMAWNIETSIVDIIAEVSTLSGWVAEEDTPYGSSI